MVFDIIDRKDITGSLVEIVDKVDFVDLILKLLINLWYATTENIYEYPLEAIRRLLQFCYA